MKRHYDANSDLNSKSVSALGDQNSLSKMMSDAYKKSAKLNDVYQTMYTDTDVTDYIRSVLDAPKLISYEGSLYCDDAINISVKCCFCSKVVFISLKSNNQ